MAKGSRYHRVAARYQLRGTSGVAKTRAETETTSFWSFIWLLMVAHRACCWRVSFLGPFRGLQPQFEDPHHLEWLIRRLSASSIWGRMHFFAGRPVRSWRRALRFRRAPPGPLPRAFARGWVGSRYRAGKCMGGGLQLGSPRNPLRAGWLPSLPLVGRGDFPQPQKLRPHS